MSPPQPIGVCVLVLNKDDQVLLGQRKNSYKAGFYGLPGGRVEVNESLHLAAQRELEEETGLKLSDLTYVGVVRENQAEYDFIHFMFVAQNVTQEPVLSEPEKCEGWMWCDIQSLPTPILPGHQAGIELFQKQKALADLISHE